MRFICEIRLCVCTRRDTRGASHKCEFFTQSDSIFANIFRILLSFLPRLSNKNSEELSKARIGKIALAQAKLYNFATNLASVLVFLAFGHILRVGVAMAVYNSSVAI